MEKTDTDLFFELCRRRRAVRHFSERPVTRDEIMRLIDEARYAPSSNNGQPWHVVAITSAAGRAAMIAACRNQTAAKRATAFLVVCASRRIALATLQAQQDAVLNNPAFEEASRLQHQKRLRKMSWLLKLAANPFFDLLRLILASWKPALLLLPLGTAGIRHWACRNAIFAAQTMLLNATALGLAACPMEGFFAPAVARLAKLPRGTMIPLVIALGYEAEDSRREPQWRKDLNACLSWAE